MRLICKFLGYPYYCNAYQSSFLEDIPRTLRPKNALTKWHYNCRTLQSLTSRPPLFRCGCLVTFDMTSNLLLGESGSNCHKSPKTSREVSAIALGVVVPSTGGDKYPRWPHCTHLHCMTTFFYLFAFGHKYTLIKNCWKKPLVGPFLSVMKILFPFHWEGKRAQKFF